MEGIREKRKGTPISNRLSHRQRGGFTYKEVSGHWPLPFPTYSYPKVSIQQRGSEWWFRMAHFWEWAHPDLVLKEQATIQAHSGKGPNSPKAVYRKHKMEMRGDNSTAQPSAEHCEELISPIFGPISTVEFTLRACAIWQLLRETAVHCPTKTGEHYPGGRTRRIHIFLIYQLASPSLRHS